MNIKDILQQRVMILDGAIGTMIQAQNLTEEEFRGEIFKNHPNKLQGDNDVLVLTCPDVVSSIHRQYLEAGADIIETNTFNAQAISQAEYHTENYIEKINFEAAHLAKVEADRMTKLTPDKPRFVAGSIGPTGKAASMSPDVENPALRDIDYDTLQNAFITQIRALIKGGVDLLLMETIFDTLNTKAAIAAAEKVFMEIGRRIPIMLSVTVSDAAGRTLSGQTMEAFLSSVSHADLLSVGLNCSFGAEQMTPFLRQISDSSPYYVSAYPNAGLPDAMGEYDETPEMMAKGIERFVTEGLVNIVGGCCGSTPAHIRAIAKIIEKHPGVRRELHESRIPWLSGLEGFHSNGAFINVGERCNVAGSRKFLRLIKEKSYDEALSIARKQVRDGAMVLDVNMDDGMLDAKTEMVNFVNLMASDPEIARVPWMVDSSRFEVIEAALKCIQGKAIVNSISLKEGEEKFLNKARRVKELGAAVVVMAFDEIGQATTYERRIEVCGRAYKLLVDKVHFNPSDIIFDPNVLSIATGMKEHDKYALDFIHATKWIHENLPCAKVSGGLSNLSFSFRGNNYLREAMHAVFLFHAIKAGMDMAIVNPSTKVMYSDIPQELFTALEDAVLYRREDATEKLIDIAEKYKAEAPDQTKAKVVQKDRSTIPVDVRLTTALKQGDDEFIEEDINEALKIFDSPSAIIEGPLMRGMSTVGELFGAGKMFLPQVVKTARTMKRAVSILQPHILAAQKSSSSGKAGKYLICTVKGDVHDIGKNIVAVVLACNNFDVIDLGVMTPMEKIVETAKKENVDFIGLSGLITPSLDEMCHVAKELNDAGVDVPLFIGGATTSAIHTAVKIAPLYDGPVFYVKDAAQNSVLAMQLSGSGREHLIACLKFEQEQLRQQMAKPANNPISKDEALEHKLKIDWGGATLHRPSYEGLRVTDNIDISEVRQYINWIYFYNLWGVRKDSPEAENIKADAEKLLDKIENVYSMRAEVGFYKAFGTDHSIVAQKPGGDDCPACKLAHRVEIFTPRERKINDSGNCLSLCDYVAPEGMDDYVGAFAVTVSKSFAEALEAMKKSDADPYEILLMQSLGDRLAEATSEWLHAKVRRELWGYAPDEKLSIKEMYKAQYQGIRPAIGYPSLPDIKEIFTFRKLVDFDAIGIRLTENGAMYPQSSVCGLYISNPQSQYFIV